MPGRQWANVPSSIVKIERDAAPSKPTRPRTPTHTRSNAFLAANIDTPTPAATPLLDGAAEGLGFGALGDIEATARQIASERGFEIPTSFEAPPRPGDSHQVRGGDNLTVIAARMSEVEGREITVAELYEANRAIIGADPNQIDIDQVLAVPVDLEALRLAELRAQEQQAREALATSMLPTEAELAARAAAREQAGRQAMAEAQVQAQQERTLRNDGALEQAGRQALAMSMLPSNEHGQQEALAYELEHATEVVAPEYRAHIANAFVETAMHDIVALGLQGHPSTEEMVKHVAAAGANLGPDEIDPFASLAAGALTQDIQEYVQEDPSWHTSEHITSVFGQGLGDASDSLFGVHLVDHLEAPTVKEALAIATLESMSMSPYLLEERTDDLLASHGAVTHNQQVTEQALTDQQANWLAMPPAERQHLIDTGRAAGYDDELLKAYQSDRESYHEVLDQVAYAGSIWGHDPALGSVDVAFQHAFSAIPGTLGVMELDEQGRWTPGTAGMAAIEQSMADHAAGRPSWIFAALGGRDSEVRPDSADELKNALVLGMASTIGQGVGSDSPSKIASDLESFGELAEMAGITGVGAQEAAVEIRDMERAYADGSLSQEDFSIRVAEVLGDTLITEEMSEEDQLRVGFAVVEIANSAGASVVLGLLDIKFGGVAMIPGLIDREFTTKDVAAGGKVATTLIAQVLPELKGLAENGQVSLEVVLGVVDAIVLFRKGDNDAALATLVGTAAVAALSIGGAPVALTAVVGIAAGLLVTELTDDPDDPTREAVGLALAAATIDQLVPDLGEGEQGAETRAVLIEELATDKGGVSSMGLLTAYATEVGMPPAQMIENLAELYQRDKSDFWLFMHVIGDQTRVANFTPEGELAVGGGEAISRVFFRQVLVVGGVVDGEAAFAEITEDNPEFSFLDQGEAIHTDPWAAELHMPPLVDAYQAALYSDDAQQIRAARSALRSGRADLGLPAMSDADLEQWYTQAVG